MTAEPIDLGTFASHKYRTPAPWPAVAGPGDPDEMPTGPWAPTEFPTAVDRALEGRPPVVAFKDCGCGVLKGEACDCAEIAAQFQAELARPIYWSQTGGRWSAVA